MLLETAAEAISILSDEAPADQDTNTFIHDRADQFHELAKRYFALVNVCVYSIYIYSKKKTYFRSI